MEIETKLLQNMTHKLSVLFVADDDDLREETTEILDELFKEVHSANNGRTGLETFQKYAQEKGEYFDLVISDIMMPKMSGIDMAKKIAEDNDTQQFIFISAHQNSDYLIDLIDIGVSSFISKPITFETLKAVLYKNCLKLEGDSLQKGLLNKVLQENEKLKQELIMLKGEK